MGFRFRAEPKSLLASQSAYSQGLLGDLGHTHLGLIPRVYWAAGFPIPREKFDELLVGDIRKLPLNTKKLKGQGDGWEPPSLICNPRTWQGAATKPVG